MNCQDIALALDDGGFDALDARARSAAVAHLESCGDCRRDQELHAQLIARSIPPMPADLLAACRALVASVPRADRAQRARSRFVLIGTVAVVAAAAAMLVAYLWPTAVAPEQRAQLAEAATMPARGGAAPAAGAPTDTQQAGEAGEPAGPVFLVFVAPLADPESARDSRLPAAFNEQVMAIAGDPVRRNALASFRAALISELALIPGVGLVEAESQLGAVTPPLPGYRIGVGLSFQVSPNGQQVVSPAARYVSVSVNAGRLQPDGKLAPVPQHFGARIDLEGECTTDPGTAATTCGDVHSSAAALVMQLRERLFPPDPSITRQRQARLLNAALEPAQRFTALEELLGMQGVSARAALGDPATLRGLLDLAATGDPAMRARIWRTVRGVAQPDLLQPLLASAVSDADEPRLEAVATLAADYMQDPRARATLESVAGTDERALVRALAGRGLHGESEWRSYLNASLLDTSRPASGRVEALVYQFNLPTRQQPQDTGQIYPALGMLDEAAIDALARLLPEASNEQPASEGRMVRVANAMAARHRTNVAVTDALLHYLRHGKSANTRMTAVQVLGNLYRDEARVRAALQESLRSDPDPQVRDWVRQIVGEGFAAASP